MNTEPTDRAAANSSQGCCRHGGRGARPVSYSMRRPRPRHPGEPVTSKVRWAC